MTATDPSSALRNATEIAKVLINTVAKKLYPPFSFCTRMVDLKTAQHFWVWKSLICLQKFLNLDQALAVRTAPGHSYHNPADKINCVLNLCMRKHSTDPEFEQTLHNCSGLGDVRKLIEKNSECNTKLLKERCQPYPDIRYLLTFKVERRAIWSLYTLCPWRNQQLICHRRVKRKLEGKWH